MTIPLMRLVRKQAYSTKTRIKAYLLTVQPVLLLFNASFIPLKQGLRLIY
ncbi:MAG: hypothetical protein LBT66_08795 [Methanobrevibacter sp.]|nr:hypothetical protein [Candidatus Methanovirga meridionalis]